MTFDAGALLAFALAVISGFSWLIWQSSATFSELKANRSETAGLSRRFDEHEEKDERDVQRLHGRIDLTNERVNSHDRELAGIEGARKEHRRHSGGNPVMDT